MYDHLFLYSNIITLKPSSNGFLYFYLLRVFFHQVEPWDAHYQVKISLKFKARTQRILQTILNVKF